MEAEVISMNHSCFKLILIVDMVKDLSVAVGIYIGNTTMNFSTCEYNYGALVFPDTSPPQVTPCSKYYAFNTI